MLNSLLICLLALFASTSFADSQWPEDKALPADIGTDDRGPKYLKLVFPEAVSFPLDKMDQGLVYLINGQIVSGKEAEKAAGGNQTVCWVTSRHRGTQNELSLPPEAEVGDVWYSGSINVGLRPFITASNMATIKLYLNDSLTAFVHVKTNFNGLLSGDGSHFDKHLEVTLAKMRKCLGKSATLKILERK